MGDFKEVAKLNRSRIRVEKANRVIVAVKNKPEVVFVSVCKGHGGWAGI